MLRTVLLGTALAFAAITPATAAISESEAQALGTTLTVFGADPKANADGSIPAYSLEAALIKAPPGVDTSKSLPDPFPEDKPVLVITSANYQQHLDKLDEGQIEFFKRWPDYKMNVYQTRRTAWYPDWVLNNIKAHATKATLINDIGDGVKGAYGGTPFPIPKNGLEVLWNHFLYWQAPAQEGMSTGWLVDRSRNLTELSTTNVYYETPFYNRKNTQLDGPYYKLKSLSIAPARSVGEGNLLWYSIDYSQGGQKVWSYTPGQRRVRLAPEFTYDTPSASYGGALFYDEVFQFSGRPDRFDWKLIGKTEKYVPYNAYRLVNGTPEQAFSDKPYLNPDLQRWELHRVWEVEATVRAGERHAYSKRKFYFDEDTWRAVLSTGYDQAGKLQRVSSQHCYQLYEQVVEGVKFQYPSCSNIYNDLPKDQYMITPLWGGKKGYLRATPLRPAADTQAGGLQGGGVR